MANLVGEYVYYDGGADDMFIMKLHGDKEKYGHDGDDGNDKDGHDGDGDNDKDTLAAPFASST